MASHSDGKQDSVKGGEDRNSRARSLSDLLSATALYLFLEGCASDGGAGGGSGGGTDDDTIKAVVAIYQREEVSPLFSL